MNSMVSQSYPDNYAGLILKRSFLVLIVVLFFCDIAIYLSLAVSARIEPQYWIALLLVLGGILAWFSPQTRWQVFRTSVFFWCVLFFALTVILFFVVPTSHIEQLKERFRDVVLLTAFLGAFLMLPGELRFVRKLVLLAVLVGVVVNLINLVHPSFLRPAQVAGFRPSGFYINPNESAIALLLGMVLSVDILMQRWRSPYVIFVLMGVLATFSREAMLGWLVATFCLCVFGVLRWKTLILYLFALSACAVIAAFVLLKLHIVGESGLEFYKYQVDRLSWFIGGGQSGGSNEMRIKVLEAGWAMFLAHPLAGAGIGSTYHWSLPVSTHNMYLLYMDDYGIIGLFLYPLLIWSMIHKAAGGTRKIVWTMAIFLLFWGLFDHNIVQNYYSLFAISLTAAMSRISADEGAKQAAPIPAEVVSG